jgi:hypothetical protein
LELVADNGISKWRTLLGPTNSLVFFYFDWIYF